MTTNAADHAAQIHAMHAEAARELGYEPTPHGGSRFTLDHLDLVGAVFPGARRIIEPNAAREGVFRVPKDAGAFSAEV